jgi:outer membrane protein TolC
VLGDFVVLDGLARSPELAQLDAAIAAQNRFVLSARRAYWAPTVALQASFDEVLSRNGAGSQGPVGLPFALPMADDSNWSLALRTSYSLCAGGERAAERRQAEIELEGLALQRAATEERIEQRIRVALEQLRATRMGTRLANQAAEAARANLELVEDAYARGVATLLDLLDAQTAARNAEEVTANARYDFLIDWLEVRRATSTLDMPIEASELDAWMARFDEYLRQRGLQPPPEPRRER